MRIHASLPIYFWVEVVNLAYYIFNRSPSLAIDTKVLEEVWMGKLVNYSNLGIFGCLAYVYV